MSRDTTIGEKQHAELGASNSHRWMACPGSIQLSRGLPESPKTIFSQEGDAAHALAELSLRHGVRPDTYVGATLEGIEVDEDMAEHVGVFVDLCRRAIDSGAPYWIERQFNLAPLNPPGPMFGTADFVWYDAARRRLHVHDLKYGRGVVVEVKGNEQLRYYALGALLSFDLAKYPVDDIEITIVQPRVTHPDGVVRSECISFDELIGFSSEILEAARATTAPDAPLVAGSHCRFCPASGICPAQLERAQEIAQTEFALMPHESDYAIVEKQHLPPAPATLPDDVFADMLGKLHILEDWINDMRSHARARLERGEEVPGFKLVAKRATRQWSDESTARQLLESQGFTGSEILVEELKSVAQIEKLLGRKAFNNSELVQLVRKESSGYNMVPAHDARPAVVLTAGEEFLALPSGNETGRTGEE